MVGHKNYSTIICQTLREQDAIICQEKNTSIRQIKFIRANSTVKEKEQDHKIINSQPSSINIKNKVDE